MEAAVTDRPILFSASMVRAILAGRKTQTRRVLKPQPDFLGGSGTETDRSSWGWEDGDGGYVLLSADPMDSSTRQYKPRWAVRDRLWVREKWSGPHLGSDANNRPCNWRKYDPIWYWADGNPETGDWSRPKSSIHMPKWASRITLLVTGVRVERLHDITEADALAEGAPCGAFDDEGKFYEGKGTHVSGFAGLWDHINGSGSWDANPWVSVTTFSVMVGTPVWADIPRKIATAV